MEIWIALGILVLADGVLSYAVFRVGNGFSQKLAGVEALHRKTAKVLEEALNVETSAEGPEDCHHHHHSWPHRPQLISDNLAIYWCMNGCRAELREVIASEGK